MIEPPGHESRDGGIPHMIAGGFRLRQPKDSSNESVFGGEIIVQLEQSPERAVCILRAKMLSDRLCGAGSVITTRGSGIQAVSGAGEQPIDRTVGSIPSTLLMGDAGLVNAG
ncbi:MAG TPA: hypothetical protein VLO00_11130 [Cryobacterium sp.]|nr:hypothetical protein [Cryobacterium sp.]